MIAVLSALAFYQSLEDITMNHHAYVSLSVQVLEIRVFGLIEFRLNYKIGWIFKDNLPVDVFAILIQSVSCDFSSYFLPCSSSLKKQIKIYKKQHTKLLNIRFLFHQVIKVRCLTIPSRDSKFEVWDWQPFCQPIFQLDTCDQRWASNVSNSYYSFKNSVLEIRKIFEFKRTHP